MGAKQSLALALAINDMSLQTWYMVYSAELLDALLFDCVFGNTVNWGCQGLKKQENNPVLKYSAVRDNKAFFFL